MNTRNEMNMKDEINTRNNMNLKDDFNMKDDMNTRNLFLDDINETNVIDSEESLFTKAINYFV